jgi:hypothetical protein
MKWVSNAFYDRFPEFRPDAERATQTEANGTNDTNDTGTFYDTDGGTWPDEISPDDYEERAAIMQFDGGLSRDEAGLQAWKATMEARGITVHPSCLGRLK